MGYYDKFLYENAITWTTDGANAGTVNFREGKFYCTNVCGVLLNKDGYANKCIAEIIGCISKRYVSYVGNPKLMNNVMSEIPILIPCLKEQEKIASFLTSIDNLISTQESNISILETYNRGLLNDIFTRKIKFKNEDGEKYPNWEEKPLSEEFLFIRNGFVGIVTDHFSDKEHGIRYIEGTNIHNGRIDDNVEVYVTEEFHQKHKKNELKADDIVMVQSGHVGDCAVVGSKYAGSNCHALIIMSNGGKVDSHYVAKYFLSDVGKKKLEILKTGNTVKHILSSDMNKFRLPFPCLEEQQKIAGCLSAIDKVVEQEKVYLEQLKTIKKGLLQQMFV